MPAPRSKTAETVVGPAYIAQWPIQVNPGGVPFVIETGQQVVGFPEAQLEDLLASGAVALVDVTPPAVATIPDAPSTDAPSADAAPTE